VLTLAAALVLGGCSGARSVSSTTTTAATTRSTAARGSTTTTAPGMGWSSPVPVSPGNSLGAVDCPTTGFCLVLDQRGDVSRFDGSTWSSAGTTGTGATGNPSLTCAGPTFCVAVAVGANQMARWTGTAFAGQVTLPAQGPPGRRLRHPRLLRDRRQPGRRLLLQRLDLVGRVERLGQRDQHLLSDGGVLHVGRRGDLHLERPGME
jgi:hypothetical protein